MSHVIYIYMYVIYVTLVAIMLLIPTSIFTHIRFMHPYPVACSPIFTPYSGPVNSLLPNLGNKATYFSNGERRRRRNDSARTLLMGHDEDIQECSAGITNVK